MAHLTHKDDTLKDIERTIQDLVGKINFLEGHEFLKKELLIGFSTIKTLAKALSCNDSAKKAEEFYTYFIEKINAIPEMKTYNDWYLTDNLMKDFEIRESNRSVEYVQEDDLIRNLEFRVINNLPHSFPSFLDIKDCVKKSLLDLHQQKRSLVNTLLNDKKLLLRMRKEDGVPYKKIYKRRSPLQLDVFYNREFDCLTFLFNERGNFYIE